MNDVIYSELNIKGRKEREREEKKKGEKVTHVTLQSQAHAF